MKSLRSLFFAVLLLASDVSAGGVTLPPGDLVSFGGAYCGLIRGTWIAGQIQGNGKFVALTQSLSILKKKLKKISDPKKRKKVKKQIKALKGRMANDATTCLQFDSGVTPPTTPQSAAAGSTTLAWSDDLGLASLNIGDELHFFCPPNGGTGIVYGTFIYTSDSDVCPAAVHTGVISAAVGGNVHLLIKPGQSRYYGSLRNSIETYTYGTYVESYAFLHPTTGTEITSSAPFVTTWYANSAAFQNYTGELITYLCPANGFYDSIWGTDIYTNDSGVCTAAVHAGKISTLRGGVINFRILPGQASYAGSTRNGVTSTSYGSWSGSFSLE